MDPKDKTQQSANPPAGNVLPQQPAQDPAAPMTPVPGAPEPVVPAQTIETPSPAPVVPLTPDTNAGQGDGGTVPPVTPGV